MFESAWDFRFADLFDIAAPRMKQTSSLLAVSCLSGVLWFMGCGRGASVQRVDLKGKATSAGQPIAYGQIDFLPDSGKSHKGPQGSAEIVNGEFDTSKSGAGILLGPHRVQVTAYESRPAGGTDETATTKASPIFVGYELTADIKSSEYNVDIPAEAKGFDSSKPQKGARQLNVP